MTTYELFASLWHPHLPGILPSRALTSADPSHPHSIHTSLNTSWNLPWQGADICRSDKGVGHSPPVYAAGNENLRCIEALLECKTNAKGMDVSGFHGNALATPDPEHKVYPRNMHICMFAEYGCTSVRDPTDDLPTPHDLPTHGPVHSGSGRRPLIASPRSHRARFGRSVPNLAGPPPTSSPPRPPSTKDGSDQRAARSAPPRIPGRSAPPTIYGNGET